MDKINQITINIGDEKVIATYSNYLEQSAQLVADINIANGWFKSDRTFGDDIALLHSEVSEAFEAYRSHELDDMTVFNCCHKNFKGNLVDHDNNLSHHTCKPEGVGSELADVLIRLLDTCYRYDIDLESEFLRKLQYNAIRGHRHGGKLV